MGGEREKTVRMRGNPPEGSTLARKNDNEGKTLLISGTENAERPFFVKKRKGMNYPRKKKNVLSHVHEETTTISIYKDFSKKLMIGRKSDGKA